MSPRTAILAALLACVSADADDTLPYGFDGFEIYKLDHKIARLTAADVDGDGLNDLLIANNDRAKIEVMLRRKEPVPPKRKAGDKKPNDLAYDRFFERKEILTEKQVSSLAAADLNGDGKIDVAYYGKPEELVVAYGDGKGAFPESVRFPIDDGTGTARALAAGDLNGDQRTDLVLLAKDHAAILHQSEKGKLQEPVKLPHSIKGLTSALIRDLDGDGRKDLVLLSAASARSVRARFQRPDGTLGAEVAFETSPWRILEVVDVDPAPGAEVLVVQRTSGVLRALTMTRKRAGELGTIEVHAFAAARGGKPRSMAIGDVNGDGRNDVVVTEPGIAQVAVYLQDQRGALSGRKLFPSLANSEAVSVADLDGDGRGEVIVLSSSERAIGISELRKDGRLPFPELLEVPGTPRVMETGDVWGDARPDLAVVAEQGKKEYSCIVFARGEKGDLAAVNVKPLKAAPDSLLVMDLDRDGRRDLLLFDGYGPMRVLRAVKQGGFQDLGEGGKDYRSGLVSRVKRGNVNTADLDGDGKPELLVATKNYARAIVLDQGGKLKVTDQANGATPRSQVQGAAAIDLDGDKKPEVALYDRDKKAVTLLKRNASGVFAVTANLPVGELEFQAMYARDLNGDQRTDLVLFGKNRFGVLYAQGADRSLKEMHTVESSARDAQLGRFDVGDLNGDGDPDIAILDSANRTIQIISYRAKRGFAEEIRWPVYEKKLHEERRASRGGAREILVTDLTGDGQRDIAILIHDRLIVYRQ